jgi:uncharacterized protein
VELRGLVEAIGRYPGAVSSIDLRRLKIRSGEQFREDREVELEALELGGQTYSPVPERPKADLRITRTSSGLLFELDFDARLVGPCFRCLADASVATSIHGREYHATTAKETEELQTPYVVDDRLDLSAWARDSVVLALPDKILCRADCAGLCPTCGKDLNAEPHEHEDVATDPRWAALAELKDRL